jgi:nucleoid DNA-binding protein
MSKVGKPEIIAKLADRTGISKKDAGETLNAVLDIVSEQLIEGHSVSLVGFGGFTVKERSARTGRNPQNGEEIQIPASKTVGFKVAGGVKSEL